MIDAKKLTTLQQCEIARALHLRKTELLGVIDTLAKIETDGRVLSSLQKNLDCVNEIIDCLE